MAKSLEIFDESGQKEFCSKLLKLLHLTNTVKWQDGTYYFSENVTILKKTFSKRFNFDDEALRRHFDYLEWGTFLKFNKSSNISIEVRKLVFHAISSRFHFDQNNPPPLFHPLSYLTIFERYFKSVFEFKKKYRIHEQRLLQFISKLNLFCNRDKLPDESLIAKNEFVAFYYSSRVEFEWNKDFIEKNTDYLDWDLLSCNSGLALTYEVIDAFKSYWNWTTILSNPSIPISIDFIEKYKSYIKWNALSATTGKFWTEELLDAFLQQWNWSYLCRNKSIKWSLPFLQKYERFIDWKEVSGNPSLELSIEVIDLYKEKFFWDGVEEEEIDDERGHYETVVVGYGISSNPSFPWNKYYMTRYEEYLDWKFIEYGNIHISWDIELIEVFSDKLSWSFIFKEEPLKNPNEVKTSDPLVNMLPFLNATKEISTLNLSHDLLIRYAHLLERNLIFQNQYIEWNFTIFIFLFNYFFNNKISTKIDDYVHRYSLFQKNGKDEVNNFLQEKIKYEVNIDQIDTKNIWVALSLEAIASNPKIFSSIMSNYFTENYIEMAIQEDY